MTKYKLYHRESGYKCRVILAELVFLFNIESQDIDEINIELVATNYYITL